MGMKIGVGIITCNREDMLNKLRESLPLGKTYEYIVINDGADIIERAVNTGGIGVGRAKNIALQKLLDSGCDYIFIIEDDMVIKSPDIFDAYIKASKETGIQHFLFGYHGPANKNGISGGDPAPRTIIKYPSGLQIALNQHCVGAFCMYTAKGLKRVGLMDENFKNVWEHVEHSYRLCKEGFCTEYWWWPDLANSTDYIEEQACSEASSSIRGNPDWQKNIQKGMHHFYEKHGYTPVQVPDTSLEGVKKKLKKLYPSP